MHIKDHRCNLVDYFPKVCRIDLTLSHTAITNILKQTVFIIFRAFQDNYNYNNNKNAKTQKTRGNHCFVIFRSVKVSKKIKKYFLNDTLFCRLYKNRLSSNAILYHQFFLFLPFAFLIFLMNHIFKRKVS